MQYAKNSFILTGNSQILLKEKIIKLILILEDLIASNSSEFVFHIVLKCIFKNGNESSSQTLITASINSVSIIIMK